MAPKNTMHLLPHTIIGCSIQDNNPKEQLMHHCDKRDQSRGISDLSDMSFTRKKEFSSPDSPPCCTGTQMKESPTDSSELSGASPALSGIPSILKGLAEEQLQQEVPPSSTVSQGARPKTAQRVTWSSQLVSTSSSEVLERHKDKLMAVACEAFFWSSPTAEAVRTMIPCTVNEPEHLLKLATKLYRVEHKAYPKAKDLLNVLYDCEFQEENIVTRFIGIYNERDDSEFNDDCETLEKKNERDFCDTPHEPKSAHSDTNVSSSNHPQSERNTEDQETLPTPAENTHAEDAGVISEGDTQPDEGCLGAAGQKHSEPKCMTEAQEQSCLARVVRREHELLVKSTKCVSCKVRPKEVIFLPCGHYSLCSVCSDQLFICPICKKEALAEVRTFLG
ncbi:uncharacterized protein LOC101856247 [Aplysia californica]|uniref:Uncharacterized protein LOC101856247 n=1 Tax=Aplysia californica TaxID=6500 RepID=A0ABM0JH06_APLCA|nr:uncharacterized protein LOC101856247 [Aplysia californica]